MSKDLVLLLYLAKKGAVTSSILVSTNQIAKDLGISQQSASRKLIELEKKGLLERTAGIDGINVLLKNKAQNELKEVYSQLKDIFKETVKLKGTVAKGLGEGSFYVSQNMYMMQFKAMLNFEPFVGTLNLKVEEKAAKQFLAGKEEVIIQGFQTKERTLGKLKAYPVHINETVYGAVIVPERTSHKLSTLEIIAPVKLRDKFNLEDGSEVILS